MHAWRKLTFHFKIDFFIRASFGSPYSLTVFESITSTTLTLWGLTFFNNWCSWLGLILRETLVRNNNFVFVWGKKPKLSKQNIGLPCGNQNTLLANRGGVTLLPTSLIFLFFFVKWLLHFKAFNYFVTEKKRRKSL